MSPCCGDARATRDDVVREALSWQRTPYHPHAMIKGVGVDCARLPEAVYKAVGLLPADVAFPQFSEQYFLHQNAEVYLAEVVKHAREVCGPPRPGDFALFQFGHVFWHGAIVIAWPRIVHVVMGRNVMLDNAELNPTLRGKGLKPRPVKFFTVWND